MRKIPNLIISFILPGIGHIVRGRLLAGVSIFVGTVALLDFLAYLTFRSQPATPWLFNATIAALGVLWLGCQAHILYLIFGMKSEKYQQRREMAFHEGLRCYARDELDEAIKQFQHVLRIEPFDRDAYFHLGVCHSRAGSYKRAIRCLKKCIEFDDDGKWKDESKTELSLARELRKNAKASDAAKAGAE